MIENPVYFMSADLATAWVINDRSQLLAMATTPGYYIALTSVDGLWGADIDREEWPIPGQTGVKSGDTLRRGQTLTLTGRIEATDLYYLNQGKRYLQSMFADTSERQLRFQLTGEAQSYINMRVLSDLDIVEQQDDMRYWRGFVVALRADDPTQYVVGAIGADVATPAPVPDPNTPTPAPVLTAGFTSDA